MTGLQIFYVKINMFWDSIPKWIKVLIYGLLSVLATKLTDDLVGGVQLDINTYRVLTVTYGYNAFLAILKDLQSGKKLEDLQIQYSQEKMGR